MQSAFLEQSFHKAQKYMKNGDKKNALLIYNKVLDKFPKNLRAINALNNINHELLLKEQSSINEQEYIVQLYNNGQITEGIIQCKKLIKITLQFWKSGNMPLFHFFLRGRGYTEIIF